MIHAHHLRVQWPNGRQLHFPNVDLPANGALCLRGPSGSGKSTWLALVAGLLSPSAGELVVMGQNLVGLSQPQRDAWRAQHIGFMPQAAYLSAALNVQDNLKLASYASGQAPEADHVAGLLHSLQIDKLLQHRVQQLSQGQRLRVALARALINQPKLLLADEPTANLDDALAHTTLALLKSQSQVYGCGLVVATHDPRAIDFLADSAQNVWLEAPA